MEVTLIRPILALSLVASALTACATPCNQSGQPTVTLRNPFLLDREPATVAGERARIRYTPVMEVPAWQAIRANDCAPAFTTPPNPCGGGAIPDAVPAVRK